MRLLLKLQSKSGKYFVSVSGEWVDLAFFSKLPEPFCELLVRIKHRQVRYVLLEHFVQYRMNWHNPSQRTEQRVGSKTSIHNRVLGYYL